MGADLGNVQPGDVVAVWGCGAVGQMAARAAMLLGAERVVVIDRFDYRLDIVRRNTRAETLNYERDDVRDSLKEMTAGRGPDAVIDCVGLEAHHSNPVLNAYDRTKQATRAETERGHALRQMIASVRSGGTVSIVGVYGGAADPLPMFQMFDKGLTLRMGQAHVRRWTDDILPLLTDPADPLAVADLRTHRLSLEQAPAAYEMFQKKEDGCIKVVLDPFAVAADAG